MNWMEAEVNELFRPWSWDISINAELQYSIIWAHLHSPEKYQAMKNNPITT